MLKMTMHCDHTIFRRFSDFRFSLVPTHAAPMAIQQFFCSITVFFICLIPILVFTFLQQSFKCVPNEYFNKKLKTKKKVVLEVTSPEKSSFFCPRTGVYSISISGFKYFGI